MIIRILIWRIIKNDLSAIYKTNTRHVACFGTPLKLTYIYNERKKSISSLIFIIFLILVNVECSSVVLPVQLVLTDSAQPPQSGLNLFDRLRGLVQARTRPLRIPRRINHRVYKLRRRAGASGATCEAPRRIVLNIPVYTYLSRTFYTR